MKCTHLYVGPKVQITSTTHLTLVQKQNVQKAKQIHYRNQKFPNSTNHSSQEIKQK